MWIWRQAKSGSALHKACVFLVYKQRLDGGWVESYLSCQDKLCQGTMHALVSPQFLLVIRAMMALLAAMTQSLLLQNSSLQV
jgi:squalene cyclase